jgi:adenosylcobinamide-GDP ribazoletransferase
MARVVDEPMAAVGFLTRIPLGRGAMDRPGAAAFGFVGAALAAVAALPLLWLAGFAHEPTLGAVVAVAVLVVSSGAMHLEGLADTADALLARDSTAADRARKDPAVGPGGLAAVVLVLLAEVAALASIAGSDVALGAWTLVVASGLARVAPVILVRSPRLEPRQGGLGAWFARGVTPLDVTIAVATAGGLVTALALATSPLNARASLVGGGVGLALGWILGTRRGGLDGDSLGASVELTFVSILVAVAVVAP